MGRSSRSLRAPGIRMGEDDSDISASGEVVAGCFLSLGPVICVLSSDNLDIELSDASWTANE